MISRDVIRIGIAGAGNNTRKKPFPHIVAHRGASAIAPENTLPAFAVGLAQGAQEVEFDLWPTADNEIAVCHDPTLDRTTTGSGAVGDRTWDYIRRLDAGVKFSPEWEGTPVPALDQAFEFLAGRAIMNIHVKDPGKHGFVIERIRDLAASWGVTDQVYIAGVRDVLEAAQEKAPQLTRCSLEGESDGSTLVQSALKFGCTRLQFCSGATSDDHIRQARELRLITNYFYSDDPEEARRLLGVGVMALLTHHPGRILRRLSQPDQEGDRT